jgi:hypothetical protein
MQFNVGNLHGKQTYAQTGGRVVLRSPCLGPTLAEVEKTMAKTTLGGAPIQNRRGGKQMNVTWKRKARAVQTQSSHGTNLDGLGKRKVGKNEADEGMWKKNV